jgi:hypothetical protein
VGVGGEGGDNNKGLDEGLHEHGGMSERVLRLAVGPTWSYSSHMWSNDIIHKGRFPKKLEMLLSTFS